MLRRHALKAGARKARLRARARPHASEQEAPANDPGAEIAPPPVDDLEEELELIAPAPEPARVIVLNEAPLRAANDTLALSEDDDAPPFDPPDDEDLLGLGEAVFEDDEFVVDDTGLDTDEDEVPFDAPHDIAECVGVMHVAPARELPLIELTEVAPPSAAEKPATFSAAPQRAPASSDLPVPPIAVHACWDRIETGEVLAAFADDKRLARADIGIARGGLDAAAAELETGARPDLLIVDTNLSGAEMLAGVDLLMQRLDAGARVIVIGAVNDIGVLRALQARGVSAYMMAPVSAEELTQTACALFAERDASRVIAVMGARGGVGASTLAHNLAWVIADRLDAPTALLDLDIGFGAAEAVFALKPNGYVTDLLDEAADDAALERGLTPVGDRLLVAAAPNAPDRGLSLTPAAFDAMLARVRRTSAFVVMDVPHVWTAWVKEALIAADEIVLVAGADLASLRNTDNLMKLLREARAGKAEPIVALSMTGVPKRPEIALKEFAEAVNAEPSAEFSFDPELYGEAETSGRLLVDLSPKSKHAIAIEGLACAITGRAPVERKAKPRRDVPARSYAPPEPPPLELGPKDELKAEPPASPQSAVEPSVAEAAEACAIAPAPIEAAKPAAPPRPQRVAEDDGLSEFERAYIEKARRKAMAKLEAKRQGARRRGDPRTLVRFMGVTAAVTALSAIMIWSERERDTAQAVSAPQAAPVAAAPAPPADPFAAMAENYSRALSLLALNDAQGLTLLRQTAEAGYPLAQYRLAKIYESGEGVEIDPILAREWTERAAAAGNVRAMHDLGFYHARGDAAPLDEAASFRWFRQAAEFGFADSQYNLGVLYEQGRGVTADPAEALFWFTLAANQGDAAAVERVTQLGANLSGAEAEQARARADAFRPRAPNAIANGAWSSATE